MDRTVEERLQLDPSNPWFAEHRARYVFARQKIQGRRLVLDIACGSGLGADLITQGGRVTIGTDLSIDALKSAAQQRTPGYHLVQADGRRLPFPDGSIDAVVSFETVEHVDNDERFVKELCRVLADDGLLLISTPNALITRPVDGVPRNPFHVREYLPQDFRDLLSSHFSQISIFGQRTTDAYGPCPYWEGPEDRSQGLDIVRSAIWKAVARLPEDMASELSRFILRRSLYPTAADFQFVPEDLRAAHVLVAVCRP